MDYYQGRCFPQSPIRARWLVDYKPRDGGRRVQVLSVGTADGDGYPPRGPGMDDTGTDNSKDVSHIIQDETPAF